MATPLLAFLHFVARRRLPAVKRPATMPGRVGHKTQVSSLCSTAPSRAGVNRKRLNITAHYPKQPSRCARLRLVACRCRALRVRVMVGYVLRPSPDKSYVGVAIAALGSSGAARGWGGSLSRRRARSLAGVAGGQFVVQVGSGETASNKDRIRK